MPPQLEESQKCRVMCVVQIITSFSEMEEVRLEPFFHTQYPVCTSILYSVFDNGTEVGEDYPDNFSFFIFRDKVCVGFQRSNVRDRVTCDFLLLHYFVNVLSGDVPWRLPRERARVDRTEQPTKYAVQSNTNSHNFIPHI